MSESKRRVVFVVGSGRSGTSTMAGALQALGLHVPQPEVRADETNPKGFAESKWVVDLHTELLQRSHVQVSDARPAAWYETGKASASSSASAFAGGASASPMAHSATIHPFRFIPALCNRTSAGASHLPDCASRHRP